VTKKKYNKQIRKYNKFKELGYLSGAGLLVLSSIELLRKEPRLSQAVLLASMTN
jgi:hypothetical protein